MDVKPASQEKLWQVMRSEDPPLGARARVLTGLEESLGSARRRRRAFLPRVVLSASLVLLAGSAAAAAGVRWWRLAHPTAPVGAPVPVAPHAPSHAARDSRDSSVARGVSAGVVPDGAPVDSLGQRPAESDPASPLGGPASPGSLAAARGSLPSSVPERNGAERNTAERKAAIVNAAPVEPSLLAQQVAEYRRISALSPSSALPEWRGMLRRWPACTLRHEIELNIIDDLGRLGRRDEARQAAAAFLRRFPKSPRAVEMRALLGGAAPKP